MEPCHCFIDTEDPNIYSSLWLPPLSQPFLPQWMPMPSRTWAWAQVLPSHFPWLNHHSHHFLYRLSTIHRIGWLRLLISLFLHCFLRMMTCWDRGHRYSRNWVLSVSGSMLINAWKNWKRDGGTRCRWPTVKARATYRTVEEKLGQWILPFLELRPVCHILLWNMIVLLLLHQQTKWASSAVSIYHMYICSHCIRKKDDLSCAGAAKICAGEATDKEWCEHSGEDHSSQGLIFSFSNFIFISFDNQFVSKKSCQEIASFENKNRNN